MRQVLVNGEAVAITGCGTVAAILEQLEIGGRFAVELNGRIVPRSEFAQRALAAGDHIEIVHAVGGG